MTLPQVCEPLFQWACRLNRSIRKGVAPPASQSREEAAAMLAEVRARAEQAGIAERLARAEPVLLYFTDFTARALPDAAQWPSLAQERGLEGGDEEFFDRLDETLRDASPEATEQISVFYTCMGLGFSGWYTGQPEVLRRKMQECAARLRPQIDADPTARVTPEAYEHVNTADLTEPPARRLGALLIVAAGLALTLLVANAVAYIQKRAELKSSLDVIIRAAEGVPGTGGAK